ncbi:hypothetical protein GALMADRAFT_242433 [Galerina marginata CBS 339.88]|uniref:DASH complex subunit DAM1 n=1 Tax=Galerina marginata (strain CBS 339.88) TaxID=685588 RepID=A0A067TMH6_GALM3|nr:hypothetical protein GALMADRAFT_242433 [Galerina marginata CBS 339.88]
MAPTQTPHRTPLRRVSQGSLFRLSRSNAYPDAPHGLGFLEPAMAEFLDETEALQANIEGMKHLSDSLATFNESFASWLYIMNMNALTTDWPQAPSDASFILAKARAEQDAIAAMESIQVKNAAKEREMQIAASADKTTVTEADTTFAANVTTATGSSNKSGLPVKKKGPKAKLTAKEKKERSIEIERIVACLPLEFRGSDPSLRRNMETVIEGVMYAPTQTVKLTDLISPPDLNQARVNKCLIALVNRKVVQKENSTGTVLYHWKGIP